MSFEKNYRKVLSESGDDHRADAIRAVSIIGVLSSIAVIFAWNHSGAGVTATLAVLLVGAWASF